jgi:hypothetical protein
MSAKQLRIAGAMLLILSTTWLVRTSGYMAVIPLVLGLMGQLLIFREQITAIKVSHTTGKPGA